MCAGEINTTIYRQLSGRQSNKRGIFFTSHAQRIRCDFDSSSWLKQNQARNIHTEKKPIPLPYSFEIVTAATVTEAAVTNWEKAEKRLSFPIKIGYFILIID